MNVGTQKLLGYTDDDKETNNLPHSITWGKCHLFAHIRLENFEKMSELPTTLSKYDVSKQKNMSK